MSYQGNTIDGDKPVDFRFVDYEPRSNPPLSGVPVADSNYEPMNDPDHLLGIKRTEPVVVKEEKSWWHFW